MAINYVDQVGRSYSIQPLKQMIQKIPLLVDAAGRARCLVSNVGPANLTAKEQPQCQKFSTAKIWRILSKTSPIKPLHHSLSSSGERIHSFLACLLSASNQHSAFFCLIPCPHLRSFPCQLNFSRISLSFALYSHEAHTFVNCSRPKPSCNSVSHWSLRP